MNVAVLIFAYNRPQHLKEVLRSLEKCDCLEKVNIQIICDGSSEKESKITETRECAERWSKNISCNIVLRKTNFGLSKSIMSGIDAAFEKHDAVIVIEDDLLVHPMFIKFHLEGLKMYAENISVMQISGFSHLSTENMNYTKFLPLTTSWGWSTWKRSWLKFDRCAESWNTKQNQELRYRFNCGGSYDFSAMLDTQLASGNPTWDILWYWTVFLNQGLVLYPPQNLVENIGFDGSGVHCPDSVVAAHLSHQSMEAISWSFPPDTQCDNIHFGMVCKWLSEYSDATLKNKKSSSSKKLNAQAWVTNIFSKILK